MKKRSFIKLHRDRLASNTVKYFSDAEFRLMVIFSSVAGWDPRQKENYQTIKKGLRTLKTDDLPTWEISKLSRIIKQLIIKKQVHRIGNSRIKLGEAVPVLEQSVPIIENNVLNMEQDSINRKLAEIGKRFKNGHYLRKDENNNKSIDI